MSDIGKELFRVADDFASHMRLLDILRSEGEDTGPLEKTIAEYFAHDVTREQIDSVIGYIRYCERMAAAARAEINRLEDLTESWENQRTWLKDTVKGVLEMSGQKRLEGLTAGSLTLRAAGGKQAVTITDASLIPDEYCDYYEGRIPVELYRRIANLLMIAGWSATVKELAQFLERIPHKGKIGEALSKKCSECEGKGYIIQAEVLDDVSCGSCGGDGFQRVPGARLEPRSSSVVLR